MLIALATAEVYVVSYTSNLNNITFKYLLITTRFMIKVFFVISKV